VDCRHLNTLHDKNPLAGPVASRGTTVQQQFVHFKFQLTFDSHHRYFRQIYSRVQEWARACLWEMTGICHMPIRTGKWLTTTNFNPVNSESCPCAQTALKVQEAAAMSGAEERLKEHGNFICTSTGSFTCATRAQGG
jgi:hypothetical protein